VTGSKRTWLNWLSDVYTGWTKTPQRGGCAGDPQYWEREIQLRASREAAGEARESDRVRTAAGPEE
jgi:hypothetical protein